MLPGGAVLLGALLLLGAACGETKDGDDGQTQDELHLDPIRNLAGTARREGSAMEEHAEAMETAAASRADHAHWAADAESIRADVGTLRIIASTASSISRDPGAHPGGAVEIGRVYGDGKNLADMGRTLIDHAKAMDAHTAVMRDEAEGDELLLATVVELGTDAASVESVGEAAVEQGNVLMAEARQLAESIGADMPE